MDLARVVGFSYSLKVWLLLAALGLVLLGSSFGVGYGLGYGAGGVSATEKAAEEARELAAEVAKREKEQLRLLNEANAANREQELAHERRISQLREEYAREDAEARAADARRIADLRAGNERLWLRVRQCGASGPGDAGPAPGGADGEARAELAPETSAALWGIAADGDAAIRQLTRLQDWADSAVKLCGSTPEKDQ